MKNPTVARNLTATIIKYGIIAVGKPAADSVQLPHSSAAGSVKVKVLFDDGDEQVALVYDQSQNARFFGVKAWYNANRAKPGDQISVEMLVAGELYRLRFISKHSPEIETPLAGIEPPKPPVAAQPKRPKSVVGEIINFRNLVYCPVNEQGVVLLFGMVFDELGFMVEEVKTGFPDAILRRYNGRGWQRERVEFEFESKNFKKHKHPVNECDLIICWQDNWRECPLEVIELESYIEYAAGAKLKTERRK